MHVQVPTVRLAALLGRGSLRVAALAAASIAAATVIFDLITPGAGNSRVFELRAPMMVKSNYKDATMKIDVWDKDMRVIGDYARKIRVPTPMFDASKPVYIQAMKSGFGAQDTAAVCAVLEKRAKLKRKKR
jgi:3-hydroxyisobutyrate dehydrogenase-like beta-hydroxyacid dehydrogenase